MDVEDALSNTAGSLLSEWRASLSAWGAALAAYAGEVGDSGPRALGRRWAAAEAAAAEAAAGLAGGGPARDLRSLMDACDACEAAARLLGAAAAAYLDPNVGARATAGMSRTFSDSVAQRARAARDAAAASAAARRAALGRAGAAGALLANASAEAVARAYADAPARSGLATELYVGALLCLGGDRADALLEGAKDAALGCADGAAAAAADAQALAAYHPLQAMGYAPAAPSPRRPAAPADDPVDLTLPRAGFSASYDLEALTSRRRALEHGPLATMFSGLNYRLVERLRTISAAPVPAARAPAAAAARAPRAGPALVTTDRGATVLELRQPEDSAVWAPYSGARPRAEAYNEASEAIILHRLRAERDAGWAPELRQRYEDAVRSGELASGECATALVDALTAELAAAYDRAPPLTPDQYRALAVPDENTPEDYITSAVARVGAGGTEARLRRLLAAPAQRVPYAAAEREARLLQAVHTADAARAAWAGLRRTLRVDPEAFDLPEPRRRGVLLRAFRRAAEEALAAAPVYCAPPSLKLYAAAELRPARALS